MKNRFWRTSLTSCLLVWVSLFFIPSGVQAIVYNTSTTNTWCVSALKAKLNSTNSIGWYWRVSDKDHWFIESSDCGLGKVTLITNDEWTTIKETFKTALGTTTYAPSTVTNFWTSTPADTGTAYAVSAATGNASAVSVTTDTNMQALPVLTFTPNVVTTDVGTGVVTNPYQLEMTGRPFDLTTSNTWCNSSLYGVLNKDHDGGYLERLGRWGAWLYEPTCGGKISLATTTEWSEGKTAYRTAINGGDSGDYSQAGVGHFWTQNESGTQAYVVSKTDGTTSLKNKNWYYGVLPVLSLGNAISTDTGVGTLASPYETILMGRPWNGTSSTGSDWCYSSLKASLNSTTNGGWLSLLGDQAYYVAPMVCSGQKVDIIDTATWASVKDNYRIGLNGSATGNYAATYTGNFWTKSRSGNQVYYVKATDGTTALKDDRYAYGVLPVLNLTNGVTTSGEGSRGNPYEVILKGRIWHTSSNQTWCGSNLLATLNSSNGGFLGLLGEMATWLVTQTECNNKVTLVSLDEWSTVKAAYRTGLNGSDSGRYAAEMTGDFWTKTKSGSNAYLVRAADGATDTNNQRYTYSAVPVVQVNSCLQTTANGDGTRGNPYELTNGCADDSTAPTGGSVTFASGTKNYTDETLTLTVADGTDADSGINTNTRSLLVRVAPLTDDGATCGSTYTSWVESSYTGIYPTLTVTGWQVDLCYQFAWSVADKAGNRAVYANETNIIKTIPNNTYAISSLAVGTIMQIKDYRFIKVTAAGLWMSLDGFESMVLSMQDFNDCGTWITPTYGTMDYANANGLNATTPTYLMDERDGKQYEVRKFADGKCWMVDSLKYGGTGTDGCANKTAFDGYGGTYSSPASKYGYWSDGTNTSSNQLYGDCRSNPGNASYGYLYNWQAAMQNASAYYNVSYTGPTRNVQGLCPQGWHLPTGGQAGEQVALDKVIGGTGANNQTSGNSFTFWRPGGNWKGVYSGYCDASGTLLNQGSYGYYWSSSQASVASAYYVRIGTSGVGPQNSSSKANGFSVRCVKN